MPAAAPLTRSAASTGTPPHAPEGGWSRTLLGRFHVTGVFWYWFHCRGVAFLPDRGVAVIVTLFTTFFFIALRRIRRAIASNLVPVLGPCGWFERQRRIYRTMWTFAWCLSERYERLGTSRAFHVQPDRSPVWDQVTASGKGFVLVTAHVGNFEVGSMLPAITERRRIHVVREREMDPRAQQFVEQLLADHPNYSVMFQDDDPLQGMRLLDALRAGDIVAVQGDRPRAGSRSVDAEFFGLPFELPAGPAALARGADAELVPVFVLREGRRRYRVVIRPPIRVARGDDARDDIARAMRCVAADVEAVIRTVPYQWFCFRTLWAAPRPD